jgi:LPXTG-motif cell wall-anchored protein
MKRLKRIMALVIAMAMVLAMTSMAAFAATVYQQVGNSDTYDDTYQYYVYDDANATPPTYKTWNFADASDYNTQTASGMQVFIKVDEDTGDVELKPEEPGDTPAETPATGNISSDKIITIQNLEDGDEVNLYKVIEWVDGQGWRVTSAFSALTTVGNDNYCQAIKDITDNKHVTLTEADVKKIEAVAENASGVTGSPFTLGGEDFTYGTNDSPADPGLYLAIVAAQTAGVVYNPIVVAADYSTTDGTETIDAETASLTRATNTPSTSVAKKETIRVDKVADDTSHDTGDPVTFTITTTVPLYSTSYTNPVFKIADTLSDNLTLDASTIKVYKTADTNKTELVDNTNVTKATTDIGDADFQITFTSAYLAAMTAAEPITIEYTATFTNDGGTSVEVEDNTVDVTYSNNPSDSSDYGTLKDETKHYTFTIDGDLLGQDEYTTSEVVKVGLDSDGNEITQETLLSNGKSIGALEGAKFALFTSMPSTDPSSSEVASEAAAKASNKIYKNTNYADGCIVESDSSGHIKIEGLDADNNDGAGTTYYLAEIEAPSGYVKDSTIYPVTIIPVFTDVTYTDEEDETLTWTVSELQSYTVKINNVQTASYTFTNNSEAGTYSGAEGDTSTAGDTVVGTAPIAGADAANAASRAGKIQNTQGVALPSTGGIGTTIFYVVGAILVIGAGVILITRRRMDA